MHAHLWHYFGKPQIPALACAVALFICMFLHHSALIFLVPCIPALFFSVRKAYNNSWKSLHLYKEDLITISTFCVLIYFTYIKLIDPPSYLSELNFADSLSFTDKLAFVSKSLVRFSRFFFLFLENFIPASFLPNLGDSKIFAFLLLLFSFIWSLLIFRKSPIKILLVICIYSGVVITLVYRPPIDQLSPVSRSFTGWIVLQYAIFLQICISLCSMLIKKSAHPQAVRIAISIIGCCFIIQVIWRQMPRWDDYRDRVIKAYSQFYYDADIISRFFSSQPPGSSIGYAYETDLYVSLLYGNFLYSSNFLYLRKR